jgi:hypothetical protein
MQDRLLPLLILLGAIPFAIGLAALANAYPVAGVAAIALVITATTLVNPDR